MEIAGLFIATLVASGIMLAALQFRELEVVRRYAGLLLGLRFLGAIARYGVIVGYYGRGDALRYHDVGVQLREEAFEGNWSNWWTEAWSGTHAIEVANAVVGAPALGSAVGEFFLFSSLGFFGLALCVVALRRSAPALPGRPLALVLLCWPSLLFWPASVGKESVLLVSVGMLAVSVSGATRRWGLAGAALALAFAIRPHVAGLEALGLFLFDTLTRHQRRGVVLLRLAISAVVAAFLIVQGAAQLGVDATEIDSVTSEIQYRSDNTNRGGSSLGSRAVGLEQLPVGLFSVLFRPLPFEANGPTMLIAAVEVVVLWTMMWRFRRAAARVLRAWRTLPFLLIGAGFGGLWAALIGVTFVNMGILARQRTLMMPFLVGVLALAVALEARDRERARPARRKTSFSVRRLHRDPQHHLYERPAVILTSSPPAMSRLGLER